jgi:1-deoxy-D-xylulose-5-phosphate synthase
MGFNYIGPIDGHDLSVLVPTLQNMLEMPGPRLLHVVTRKGKGYHPAEGQPITYHGVSPFDPTTGKMQGKPQGGPSYTAVFGSWLCDAAERDPRLMGITPAMCEGSGLTEFSKCFPDRYFDVGIAEQHALTLAAGMACEGLKPVVAIYSTFLQRAYDQLIHDICLQNLDVTLAVDRAGLVGADGATHAGSFDLSFCRPLPNLLILAPADEAECRALLQSAYEHPGPALVRYPRGSGPGVAVPKTLTTLAIGRGEIRRQGKDVALLAFGSPLTTALGVAEGLDATVANMRFVKPLDGELIERLAQDHGLLVTLEENVVAGGAGSAVAEFLFARGWAGRLLQLGLPDRFIEHGTPQQQIEAAGLDRSGILQAICQARGEG